MRTPGNDGELATGFLLSEGVIGATTDLEKIASHPRNKDRNVIDIYLRPSARLDLASLKRHIFVSSSCGLCGKASIQAVHQHFPPIRQPARVSAKLLLQLPELLAQAQNTFALTGGLHAAGLFSLSGELLAVREDIGRHNAVDKILGYAVLNELLPLEKHILLVSGRASFEIMQKALAARIPAVAAISAPSSLAVAFAQESKQLLAGFVRGQRLNVYAGKSRLLK